MSAGTLEWCSLYLDILRVFSNVIELRILRLDYHGFKVGHKSRDWCCKKRRKYTQRHTHKRPGFCGAETGANTAPPKDCQEFLGSTRNCKRSMEQILLELCQHLDLRLWASRTVREYIQVPQVVAVLPAALGH